MVKRRDRPAGTPRRPAYGLAGPLRRYAALVALLVLLSGVPVYLAARLGSAALDRYGALGADRPTAGPTLGSAPVIIPRRPGPAPPAAPADRPTAPGQAPQPQAGQPQAPSGGQPDGPDAVAPTRNAGWVWQEAGNVWRWDITG